MGFILKWVLVIILIWVLPKEARARHGYRNVPTHDLTVSIHHSIPQSDQLLLDLQKVLTDASKIYHHVTQKLLLSEVIQIVVPKTWNTRISGKVNNLEEMADIRIENYHITKQKVHSIHTVQSGECGQHGDYISMTTGFLNHNRTSFSVTHAASKLVQEIIRYRFGIFENVNLTKERTGQMEKLQDINCHGQGGWHVFKKELQKYHHNPDVKSSVEFNAPKFTILQVDHGNVYMFLLDVAEDSKNMSSKFRFVLEQFKTFVKDHLPIGSYVGFLASSQSSKVLKPPTLIVEQTNWKEFFQETEIRVNRLDKNLNIAIEECLQEIKQSNLPVLGARFILLTDSETNMSQINATDFEHNMSHQLMHHGIKLHTFLLGHHLHHHNKKLQAISEMTRGQFYVIEDSESAVKQGLPGILASLEPNNVIVTSEKLGVLPYTINIDSQLNSTQIYVGQNISEPLKINLTLSNSNGELVSVAKNTSASDHQQLTFKTNQTGQLVLQSTEKNKELNLQVVSKPLLLNGGVTHVSAWLHQHHPNQAHYSVIKVFAHLKSISQLHHVKVLAEVVHPSGNISHIKLKDNGLGLDMVPGDEIYSGYFTHVSGIGKYTGFVRVHGQQKKHDSDGELEHFDRFAYAGVFWINGKQNKVDMIPPAEIRDLTVIKHNNTQAGHIISVNWTAVGDNMDHGTVATYELRITVAHHRSMFAKWYHVLPSSLVEGSLVPVPSGKTQNAAFIVPSKMLGQKPKILHIGIISHDHKNNTSEMSNVETVHLEGIPLKKSNSTPNSTKAAVKQLDKNSHNPQLNRNSTNVLTPVGNISISIEDKGVTPEHAHMTQTTRQVHKPITSTSNSKTHAQKKTMLHGKKGTLHVEKNTSPTSMYSFHSEHVTLEANESINVFLIKNGINTSRLLQNPGKSLEEVEENETHMEFAYVNMRTSTIVASWVAGVVATFFGMAIIAAIIKNKQKRKNVYNVRESEENFMENIALKEASV